ncbi:unnamed protein product [Rotaria sp. Silwood2]|nr:unnamed protein product [Rotaria sp. Silwood2]
MSSSEDEIMEIINVPSSSDNDLSILSKTTSNTIVATISSSPVSKENKRYKSNFKKEWLSKSYFSTFFRECKTDRTKALCITCNVQFSIQNSELGDINHRIQTKNVKIVQSLSKLIHQIELMLHIM